MSLITDGILIAASLTACFYCLVLNVRLKALRNTKTGIGATITQLADSVGELETSLEKTNAAHSHSVEKLEDLIGEAGTLADFLSDLLANAETANITMPAPAAPPEPVAASEETSEQPTPEPGTETGTETGKEETAANTRLDPGAGETRGDEAPEGPSADKSEHVGENEDDSKIELNIVEEEPLKAGVG